MYYSLSTLLLLLSSASATIDKLPSALHHLESGVSSHQIEVQASIHNLENTHLTITLGKLSSDDQGQICNESHGNACKPDSSYDKEPGQKKGAPKPSSSPSIPNPYSPNYAGVWNTTAVRTKTAMAMLSKSTHSTIFITETHPGVASPTSMPKSFGAPAMPPPKVNPPKSIVSQLPPPAKTTISSPKATGGAMTTGSLPGANINSPITSVSAATLANVSTLPIGVATLVFLVMLST
ncbi:BgTH12-04761 [Blumeria graminis f. sp. triticale]|uniref:BgTH12-04761 n=1 Tax=Blumeria graminis f. sp. triticale TaxID=1689686 RepID=A0A9W4DC37_BLUGR|nr:hypothetical protein BGT96224_AcSP30310 [Blumeria graminis f. sp. tritici 96224]CAD6499109.1 BgTH12-04761 [Blumeria graminis f. sp. triticale]